MVFAAFPLFAGAGSFSGSATDYGFCTSSGRNICNGIARESVGLLPITDSIDLIISVPTESAGDALFSFTAYGDFNTELEYATIHVENFVIGDFLNSNLDDDLFSDDGFLGGAWADIGNEYSALRAGVCALGECVAQPPRTGTVTIPYLDMQSILADGLFSVHVWISKAVSNGPCCNHPPIDEYFTANLTFATVAPVPGPPVAALLLSALAMFGVIRRRI